MLQFILGLFVMLHGLVHVWYVVLSQGLVVVKPGMPELGWTGKSWLFTALLGDPARRLLASLLYALAALSFVISGVAIFVRTDWWSTALMGSALFSCAIILILWDGSLQLSVQKGLIAFTISLMIVLALFVFRRPSVVL